MGANKCVASIFSSSLVIFSIRKYAYAFSFFVLRTVSNYFHETKVLELVTPCFFTLISTVSSSLFIER